jgi:hypothetical protein
MRQVKRPNPFSSYTALMCDLLEEEPTCFEEAIQRKEWADAMTEEYQSIMKNKVFEIVPRSKSKDVVSSRWLFKIKMEVLRSIKQDLLLMAFPRRKALTMKRHSLLWPDTL